MLVMKVNPRPTSTPSSRSLLLIILAKHKLPNLTHKPIATLAAARSTSCTSWSSDAARSTSCNTLNSNPDVYKKAKSTEEVRSS
jgi:hypothetical protein